ncbi:MAG: hypothetical protein P8Y65_08980 [Campylobacterales bacterium]|jgi:hypothetical protein
MRKFILFLASSAAFIFFTGCGGSSGGSNAGSIDNDEMIESAVFYHTITADTLTGMHLVGNNDTGSVHLYFETAETVTVETTDTNGIHDIYSSSNGSWSLLEDNATVLVQMPDENVSVTFEQEPSDDGRFAVAGKAYNMLMFWEDITYAKWWFELDSYNDDHLAMMNDKRFILALPGENVLLDLNSSGGFTLSTRGGDTTGTWELYKEFSGALQLEADPDNGKLHLNYQEEIDGETVSVDLFIGFRDAPTEVEVPLILTTGGADLFYAGRLQSVTDLTPAP